MLFRRPMDPYREYLHHSPTARDLNSNDKNKDPLPDEIRAIPLPNEREPDLFSNANGNPSTSSNRPSFFDFIRSRVHFEEIILIGLIFLLMDEGVDDELLFIVLIFVLLT